jgi:hypothetical protein
MKGLELEFYQLLGEFAKLRKATIRFIRQSFRPSVHTEQLRSLWTDFHEI